MHGHLCIPSPGLPNDQLTPSAAIVVQSGDIHAAGSTTLNLEAAISSGASLAGARCHFTYGDGYISESCNPPAHAMNLPGNTTITLSITPACGLEMQTSLTVTITVVSKKGRKVQGQQQITEEDSRETGCRILSTSGVILSEIYPAPTMKDSCVLPGLQDTAPLLSMADPLQCEEWIELRNVSSEGVSLCGWKLDDGEKGSRPFDLGDRAIAPGDYVLIPKALSKIALNDAGDSARLFAPVQYQGYRDRDHYFSGTTLVDALSFSGALRGESLALRSDATVVWSPYPTPGRVNTFMTEARKFPRATFLLSAALPNPQGEDTDKEWLEIRNLTEESQILHGWTIASASKDTSLSGLWIRPLQTLRVTMENQPMTLRNLEGKVELRDPDGYVVSALEWQSPKEGEILRSRPPDGHRITVHVTKVIDGDTFMIEIVDTKDPQLPASILHRWSSLEFQSGAMLPVRLIGVDAPELYTNSGAISHNGNTARYFTSALIDKKNIELIFDSEIWDRYERILAYAVIPGTDDLLQSALLRSGNAIAEPWFAYSQKSLFVALESEAKRAKMGRWKDGAEAMTVAVFSQSSSGENPKSRMNEKPKSRTFEYSKQQSIEQTKKRANEQTNAQIYSVPFVQMLYTTASASSLHRRSSSSTRSMANADVPLFPVRWRVAQSSAASMGNVVAESGSLLTSLTMYSETRTSDALGGTAGEWSMAILVLSAVLGIGGWVWRNRYAIFDC